MASSAFEELTISIKLFEKGAETSERARTGLVRENCVRMIENLTMKCFWFAGHPQETQRESILGTAASSQWHRQPFLEYSRRRNCRACLIRRSNSPSSRHEIIPSQPYPAARSAVASSNFASCACSSFRGAKQCPRAGWTSIALPVYVPSEPGRSLCRASGPSCTRFITSILGPAHPKRFCGTVMDCKRAR